MAYPKYKYHKTEGSKLVHTEAEEKELGKDWAESPAEFEEKEEQPKEEKTKEKPAKEKAGA